MIRLLKNCLVIGAWLLVIFTAPTARANTDPKYATASATATVPSFITSTDSHAPTSPILLRPVDEAVTSDPRPELVWRHSEDEDSNTVRYTLFLNGVATYLGISDQGNSQGAGYTARVEAGDIRLLPSAPLPDGRYTWRVEAYDLLHHTSSSATWTFTIDTTAPSLTLIELDYYHIPLITEGANFDIAGPKDVYFVVSSDPFSNIQILLTSPDISTLTLTATTNANGLATLYTHLLIGLYSVNITALDRARNTLSLPNFTLTVTQSLITLPIPGKPPLQLPYTPISLPSLPATISLITTSGMSSLMPIALIAIAILILLIFLWSRRYNLILIDYSGRPLLDTKIYHSIPTTKGRSHLFMTTRKPLLYDLPSTSRLYIPHLTRYSTLTIRVSQHTHILSLSAQRRVYTLIIG